MKSRALLLLLAFLSVPSLLRAAPHAGLAGIVADYEKLQLEQSPVLAMQQGKKVENLPDLSYEADSRQAERLKALRDRLAKIDPKELTHEEWLSREMLDWQIGNALGFHDHFWTSFQVTPYASPLKPLQQVFTGFSFKTVEDRERYLKLLKQHARLVDQLRANLEAQRAKGILLPKAEIDPAAAFVRSFVQKPEESAYAVSSKRQENFYPEGVQAFQKQVQKVIETTLNPAFEALAATLSSPEYRAQAPERIGLGQYPGGPEAYRFLVRCHTSLDVTPEEVHQRGLAEVERLNARLEEVRKSVGFKGDLDAFRQYLRTDSRFFAKTPEEVAERLMAPIHRVEPKVSELFLRTPKAPYGVARLEPSLEATVTYGYYRQPEPGRPDGAYLFNASRLAERPLLAATPLILHELIPGHHFQVALALENPNLPAFRKNLNLAAYSEGWAVYASGLGEEMGAYTDPYDLAGWITQDLFLSTRLVVDTGLNALGWTREQAIDFMKRNTFESETQIGTETLRYAVDIPGQALAYKMGSGKIRDLRAKAEKELGPKFEIRRFHEAVLGSGALPLSLLEKQVDWWIGEEKKR